MVGNFYGLSEIPVPLFSINEMIGLGKILIGSYEIMWKSKSLHGLHFVTKLVKKSMLINLLLYDVVRKTFIKAGSRFYGNVLIGCLLYSCTDLPMYMLDDHTIL